MKKIKFILVISVIFVLVIGISVFIKKDDYNYYLVMGDYISNNQKIEGEEVESFSSIVSSYLKEEKLVSESNVEYLKNNMTSKKLLEMIEANSYKEDNEDLVSLIKKSKYITITLGINDILNQIKYDSYSKKLIYDKEIIVNKIEIFKHNYHQIIQEIKDINKDAKVILVGNYVLYSDEELSGLVNDATIEVSRECDVYYVDISDIRDKYMYQDNELYLNNLGQEEVSKKVISLIKKIEEI